MYIISKKVPSTISAGSTLPINISNDSGRPLEVFGYSFFYKTGLETAEIKLKSPSGASTELFSPDTQICGLGAPQTHTDGQNPMRMFPKNEPIIWPPERQLQLTVIAPAATAVNAGEISVQFYCREVK